MISIILPSYLGSYKTQCSNPEGKLLRAVSSALDQTYTDFELLVIADGCKKTIDIIDSHFIDKRIKFYFIKREGLFTGFPRNKGIEFAKGDYICYLDSDDCFGVNHLQALSAVKHDWAYFDDYHLKKEQWQQRLCNINKLGQCGTSNIIHSRKLNVKWKEYNQYGYDDFTFIRELLKHKNFTKVTGAQYYVCHVPFKNGYDV